MASTRTKPRPTLLKNTLVFNGNTIGDTPQTVMIKGDFIGSPTDLEGTDEEVVDGIGCTLLPGLIDCHVHLRIPDDDFRELASYGMTTAINMGAAGDMLGSLRGKKGYPRFVVQDYKRLPKGVFIV